MLLVFGPAAARAQYENGSLVGSVRDSSGAALAGAKVVVTNTGTGLDTVSTTNESGDWELPSLRVGAYRVTVSMAGFQSAVADNITLLVGSRQRIDLTLRVGAASESVQVNGVALQLETDSSQRGQVVTQYQTEAFPLVNRNYSQLVLLTTGTRQSSVGTASSSLVREGSFNVEGQRSTFNNYLLDGLDNNAYGTSNQGFSNQIIQAAPDSVAQFQVVTNNENAEYGRASGATVNVAFASGTNAFHFDVYEFLRNTSLNAIGYFYNPAIGKQQFHRNQFGGNFGGPIIKDKAFFFLDYEGFRQSRSLNAFSTIPDTAEAQNATFPVSVRDPYCTPSTENTCVIPAGQSILTSPYAGDLSAAALGIAKLFPGAAAATSNNYETLQNFTDTSDKYDLRLDYQIDSKQSAFARASLYKETAIDFTPLPLPLDGSSNGRQRIMDEQIAFGYTRQIAANQLLDARIGASYTKGGKYTLSLGQPNAASFGIPGLPDDNPLVAGGLPSFSVSGGYSAFGRQSTNPQWQYPFEFDPKINYSWVLGRHSLKFGYEYQQVRVIDQDVNPIYGIFTFASKFTNYTPAAGSGLTSAAGDNFADFLFGAASKEQLTNFFVAHMRQVMHFGYIQDDWKLTPQLTLNIGLRYEYGSPYWDKDGNLSNYDPANSPTTLKMLHASKDGSIYDRSLVNPDRNDFAPRFGFAYALGSKTSIRGGFGVSYIHFNRAGSGNELPLNAPQVSFYVAGQSAPNAGGSFRRLDQGFAPGTVSPNPAYPDGFNPITTNIAYIPRGYRDSYVESYFLAVQRELAKNILIDLAYVGNHGVKLLEFGNFNQGNPALAPSSSAPRTIQRPVTAWGDITYAYNGSYSNYNSLQFRYEQRFVAGLTLLNSFTWSRTFDNAAGSLENTNGNYPGPQNIYNMRADYGPSNYDQPLTNTTSFVYDLPFGRGRDHLSSAPGIVNQVVGGWQLSAINTMTSGQPLTVMYSPSGTIANQISGISQDYRGANNYRPNRVPGTKVLASGPGLKTASYVQYLNNSFSSASGVNAIGAFTTNAVGGNPALTGSQDNGLPASPFGNASRNLAYSNAYFDLDFALNKTFTLPGDRARLQFRSEFYNALNKTNFAPPGTTLSLASTDPTGTAQTPPSPGSFGRITSTFPARIIQFGLKLTY